MTQTQMFIGGIAVTLFIAIANIVNAWLLARYNKKKVESLAHAAGESTTPTDSEKVNDKSPVSWKNSIWSWILLVSGIYNTVRPFFAPAENPLSDMVQIAVGIGAILFALMLLLFMRYLEMSFNVILQVNELVRVVRDLTDVMFQHRKHALATARTLTRSMAVIDALKLPKKAKADLDAALDEMQEAYKLDEEGNAADEDSA